MQAKEKRQLENQLSQWGWPGLRQNSGDGDLVQFMADMINAHQPYQARFGGWIDQHAYFANLLNECDADKRAEMYGALAPRLKFRVRSLAQYEMMIQERAGRMVSQRKMRVEGEAPQPIVVGGVKYAAAPKALASSAMMTLHCHRCQRTDRFVEPTPVAAMTAARKAGWVREKGIEKEICPDCAKALDATVVRLSNKENLAIYDRRACKLDA